MTDLYSTYERINSVSPRTLLKIVLYSYMNGDYSSRSMELNCKRDINFMFLLEGSPAPWFYTKEEIIYKLSQGAHEESERVQTSGLSNPVERTVLNCDKVLASMNREVQTQRTEQFLEPYYEVCEQIELFEVGLRSLRGQTRLVAEQLFVDGKKQSEITGAEL